MGEEAEALCDQGIAAGILREVREKDIERTASMLAEMPDTELLDYLCRQGSKLNTLKTFQTYTIAKRIRDNGWAPTHKQREALINTAAIALNP
jgi:hypothetical protein